MAKTDYSTLAQAFLRLWQDQLHKQMTDPEAIKTMLSAMQNMTGGAYDPARNTAHAPDARDDAIRSLNARIKQLERDLESMARRMETLSAKADKPDRAGRKRNAERVAKTGGAKRRSDAKPAGRKIKAGKTKRKGTRKSR